MILNISKIIKKKIGKFGGLANLIKFEKHIKPSDKVLDFGCGGGFLLKNLKCKEKIGVELNDVARNYCNSQGIDCYKSIDEIENSSVDVVISNHCLEHTIDPIGLIEKMYLKLKKGGKIIICVPLDSHKKSWKPDDVNYHLFSFSQMNLGNILNYCQFKEIKTRSFLHKWPPLWDKIQKIFGWKIFHLISYIYGRIIKYPMSQIIAYGIK